MLLELRFAFQGVWADPRSADVFEKMVNDAFVPFLNVVFEPSVFVAFKMIDAGRQPGDQMRTDIKRSQALLRVIANSVKGTCNQRMPLALKAAVTLLDADELRSNAQTYYGGDVQKSIEWFQNSLADNAQALSAAAQEFKAADATSRSQFRGLSSAAASKLQSSATDLARYVKLRSDNPGAIYAERDTALMRDFAAVYRSLPEADRISCREHWFDDRCFKAYAEAATFEGLLDDVVTLSTRLLSSEQPLPEEADNAADAAGKGSLQTA